MQLKQSGLPFTKVLLIDREEKNKNDRTWCFWSKEKHSWYESTISKRWTKFRVKSKYNEVNCELGDYYYQLIQGKDFYTFCTEALKKDSRFEFVYQPILRVGSDPSQAFVETDTIVYKANYVFNSAFRDLQLQKGQLHYVQHFKGWMVETETPVFDDERPVFMDFNVEQQGDCRFVYVIPFSKTKALVEYTGFSPKALATETYDEELRAYLKREYKLDRYKVLEVENGQIPMSNGLFVNPYGERVVNIGTAGGSSKPSTGYTFYFIQRHIAQLVQRLMRNQTPVYGVREARYTFYDSLLLRVIDKKAIEPARLFSGLFEHSRIEDLLAFLNEESTMIQDFRIMNAVKRGPFIAALFR